MEKHPHYALQLAADAAPSVDVATAVAGDPDTLPPLHPTLRTLRLAVLAAGPLVSLLLFDQFADRVATFETSTVRAVLVLLWSPLFFSIPALLLQNARDRALPDTGPVTRALRLVPHLLLSASSPVRREMAVSVTAWLLLAAVCAADVAAFAAQILR